MGLSPAELATALWRLLATAPREAQRWAGIGYRLGLIDGRQQVLDGLKTSTDHLVADGQRRRAEREQRQAVADAAWRDKQRQRRSRPHAEHRGQQPDRTTPERAG